MKYLILVRLNAKYSILHNINYRKTLSICVDSDPVSSLATGPHVPISRLNPSFSIMKLSILCGFRPSGAVYVRAPVP